VKTAFLQAIELVLSGNAQLMQIIATTLRMICGDTPSIAFCGNMIKSIFLENISGKYRNKY